MLGRRRARGSGSASWQDVGLVLLVAAALVLCVMAYRGHGTPTSTGGVVARDPGATTEPQSPDAPSAQVTTVPTNPPAGEEGPPHVGDARRIDFTRGGDLPGDFRAYDNPSVGTGIVVRDGLLQHGRPDGPKAVSTVETELGADVRKLGARMRFPDDDAGAVVLVAWQDSLVDARRAGRSTPRSGLRLMVSPGAWELSAVPGGRLAAGSFQQVPGTMTVEVARDGADAWVVDPSGLATRVSDPRIAELAGPWASWQLYERNPDQTPAVIEAVWAG